MRGLTSQAPSPVGPMAHSWPSLRSQESVTITSASCRVWEEAPPGALVVRPQPATSAALPANVSPLAGSLMGGNLARSTRPPGDRGEGGNSRSLSKATSLVWVLGSYSLWGNTSSTVNCLGKQLGPHAPT